MSRSKPIWGAKKIGEEIDRSAQQTHYLLRHGLIRSAKKVGHQWCAYPDALRREFGAVEQREDVEAAS
jgi:hypothetical protein